MPTRESRLQTLSDGRLQIDAPAKLNVGLRIFPARPDGFHDVETWMLATSWHDTVTVTPGGPLKLVITGRSEGIPTELGKNLVGHGALALAKAAAIEPTGSIQLHKVVPPGGGLGGGSADAACTLVALNKLWNLNWPDDKLAEIAATLGSDVPFFITGRAALCTGRGEIMTPLLPRHPLFAVLIIPPYGCPTKDVYQTFDKSPAPTAPRTDWQQLAAAPAEKLNTLLVNDLAPPAFKVAPPLADLRDHAAAIIQQPVHMTGSGSTLFTLASSSVQANHLTEILTAALPRDHGVVPVRLFGVPPSGGQLQPKTA